jgi:hypothetical protein
MVGPIGQTLNQVDEFIQHLKLTLLFLSRINRSTRGILLLNNNKWKKKNLG